MKHLFFAAVAAATITLSACSSADKAAKEESNDFKAKIENCTNPDSIAVYVKQAQEYADKLVKEGKIDEAKKYLADIQPVVEKKAPALVSTFDAVKAAVDKIPASADSLKNDAAEKAEAAKDAAVDSVKSAAANAADAAKAKADEAAQKAGDAARTAVKDASDKANKAAADASKAAKDKVNDLLKK